MIETLSPLPMETLSLLPMETLSLSNMETRKSYVCFFIFYYDLILFLSEAFQFYVMKSVCASKKFLLFDETDYI